MMSEQCAWSSLFVLFIFSAPFIVGLVSKVVDALIERKDG